MGGNGFCQPAQVIPPFEQADQPVAGILIGKLEQVAGRPVEIIPGQPDLGERIAVMRVESGRTGSGPGGN